MSLSADLVTRTKPGWCWTGKEGQSQNENISLSETSVIPTLDIGAKGERADKCFCQIVSVNRNMTWGDEGDIAAARLAASLALSVMGVNSAGPTSH